MILIAEILQTSFGFDQKKHKKIMNNRQTASVNVFGDDFKLLANEVSDETLIAESVAGNRDALEVLVRRHQSYLYNISLRLFMDPEDALDATQEVLIKIITRLDTFRGTSDFKTWAYRIVVNHFLNLEKFKMERFFERNFDFDRLPSQAEEPAITEQEVEEVRVLCSTAMLLCLNREQRLIYIIGEIFEADHNLGAQLFDTTPANFRVKLHRAKTDLLSYVRGKCGLIDESNVCRCPKKTKQMIVAGVVDKNRMRFNRDYQQKVSQIVLGRKTEVSNEIQFKLRELFQDSPFQIKAELDQMLGEILATQPKNQ